MSPNRLSTQPPKALRKTHWRSVTVSVTLLRMIQSVGHKGLERFYKTGKKNGIKADHAKRLQLILGGLNASTSPEDMDLPGLFLHRLTGDRAETRSVRVSGNWRVPFRFDGPHAEVVDYEDYH